MENRRKMNLHKDFWYKCYVNCYIVLIKTITVFIILNVYKKDICSCIVKTLQGEFTRCQLKCSLWLIVREICLGTVTSYQSICAKAVCSLLRDLYLAKYLVITRIIFVLICTYYWN